MNKFVLTYNGLSILIPLLIGITKFSYASRNFRLFVILLGIGACNEFLNIYMAATGKYTVVNNNIYVLVESVLIILFLQASGAFESKKTYLIFIGLFATFWVTETSINTIHYFSTFFRIFYSFTVVLLSIKLINIILSTYQQTLLKNPTFLICIGFVIYFTLNALNNAFWLYGIFKSNDFLLQINTIMVYINVFINLLFAWALIWIPKKQASLLQS